jgi:predicted PurR-regulated permease PerM
MTPQRRATRHPTTWSLGIAASGIAALYFAREILIPLAFALVLSFLLTSPVAWLQKLLLSRVAAVVIVIVLALSAATGTGWIVGTQLLSIVNALPRYRLNIHNKVESIRAGRQGALGRAAENIDLLEKEIAAPGKTGATPTRDQSPRAPAQPAKAPTEVQVVPQPKPAFQYVYDFLRPALHILGSLGIIVIFSIFMLVNREDLRNRVLRLVGVGQLNAMTQAFDDATQRISKYLRTQFLVNFGFAALISAGLFLVGVPSPVLWGVVAGIFRLVPYIGVFIAASMPLVLSLAVFDGWSQPLLVFLLFTISEIILSNFIEPLLYGAHTGISALALLVATVFWAVLWGPAGLVLSAPLTVLVVVLGRHVPRMSFLHILLGDEQVLAPEAQLFQRLLAMDQQEAREVVDASLKEKSLVETYDSLFIPALLLIEQERHKGVLDHVREDFIFLSIDEIVAELSNYKPAEDTSPPAIAEGGEKRVICLAANDHADEIAAAMLAQLLEQSAATALCFPAHSSLDELARVLEPDSDDTILISAMPPFAFATAGALHQKLRRRFPRVKICVAIWGFVGDAEKLRDRFDRVRPDAIVTTLAQAVAYGAGSPNQSSGSTQDLLPSTLGS